MRDDIQLLAGPEARSAIAGAEFRADWDRLRGDCRWGTVLQAPGFVNAWYGCYGEAWSPLLVSARDHTGALVGLLPLAENADGRLIAAGGVQAEYQAWLAREDRGDRFIEEALDLLASRRPGATLDLAFLPPGTPLGWTRNGRWAGRCLVREEPRALLQLDGAGALRSLKKKSNRSRLNRLARSGPVRFRRLHTPAELDAVLDQIIALYDFRRAAAGTPPPFRSDPRKRAFHLALLERPDLLHATVLEAGDRVVAAHLGYIDGKQVSLGIIAHAPDLAAHSPGKLHLLHLTAALADEGFTTFDLTPSGDYKERFATHHDTVHRARVALSSRAAAVGSARAAVLGTAKRALRAARLEHPARALVRHARQAGARGPSEAARALLRHLRSLWTTTELVAYARELAAPVPAPDPGVRRDRVEDLLRAYAGEGRAESDALAHAERRLAQGARVYTTLEGDAVAHVAWLGVGQLRSNLTEVHQILSLPPDCAVVFDCVTMPAFRGRGHFGRVLVRMLADAAAEPGIRWAISFALADNTASRRALERAGFRACGTLTERRRLGRVSHARALSTPFDLAPAEREPASPATSADGDDD